MVINRQINFNLDTQTQFDEQASEYANQSQRQPASQSATEAFETALSREKTDATDNKLLSDKANSSQTLLSAKELNLAAGPWNLLAAKSATAVNVQVIPNDISEKLADTVKNAASQLRVSADGRRAVEVDFKDEIIPGVTVSLAENAGRLQIEFKCQHEKVREKLCLASQKLASDLAQKLKRAIALGIETDDPDDRHRHEVFAE